MLSRQTTRSISSSHQVVRRNSCAMQLRFAKCILSDGQVSHSRLHTRTHDYGASCYWSELRPIPSHLICRPGRTVGEKGGHLHPARGGWDHRELRTAPFKEFRCLLTRNFSTQRPPKTNDLHSAQTRTRSLASYMHARERANAMFRLCQITNHTEPRARVRCRR